MSDDQHQQEQRASPFDLSHQNRNSAFEAVSNNNSTQQQQQQQQQQVSGEPKEEQQQVEENENSEDHNCLLYTSPSPRDKRQSRMPSSA